MSTRAVKLANQVQEMFRQADNEGRALTAEERSYAQSLLNEAKGVGPLEMSLNEIGHQLGGAGNVAGDGSHSIFAPYGANATSPGGRFVNSQGYKSIRDPSTRPQEWSTGLVDISDGPPTLNPYVGMKGTLLEGAGAPGAGSGGGFLPVPQVAPGVVTTLAQPLTLEALLSANIASSNTVRYAIEGTAVSGASGVAEGGTKPESTLGVSTKDEPVKKVATSITTSDELLEDAAALQTYINSRLTLFCQIELERQLYRGAAGGNEIQGILTSRNVPVYTAGTTDNRAIQTFKAMNSVRGSAFVEPEWIVMHPSDYQIIRLLTDNQGQLLGGGPFLGAYGGATQVGSNGQITGGVDTLWGKPVHVTSAIGGPGTALIGTSAGACVWSKGGTRVEASNAHLGYFTTDLVAIRAERRAALTVYRPGAFCELRFAVGPGG